MKVQDITNIPAEPEASRAWRAMPKVADPATVSEAVKAAGPSENTAQDHPKELERIAEEIRKYIRDNRTSVDISVDADLQQVIIRVLSQDTGEVIRQYPDDAALDVMKHLKEIRGLLLHKKG